MRGLIFLVALYFLFAMKEVSPSEKKLKPCADCHQKEHVEYGRSLMAVAARTQAFLDEWKRKERDAHCLDCHAPSRQGGIACIDCHGAGEHPFPKLKVPQICARCHDAPGEATLRSYRISPATRQRKDCLDCHLAGERTGHDFKGPTRPGFLDSVANLRMSMRRDGRGYTALIRVRHKAGHSLPGGTTGRAVWLVVEEVGRDGDLINKSLFRFGWHHNPKTGWQDRTLPPGPGKVIEVSLLDGEKTGSVIGTLIYRFAPGGLDRQDSKQVILDQARFALPGE